MISANDQGTVFRIASIKYKQSLKKYSFVDLKLILR